MSSRQLNDEWDSMPPVSRSVADQPLVVEVRNRFDRTWSHGFEIVETNSDANRPCYRLRRLSDGRVLPEWFSADEIMAERHRLAPRS